MCTRTYYLTNGISQRYTKDTKLSRGYKSNRKRAPPPKLFIKLTAKVFRVEVTWHC